jgi:hypothetical protein
MLFVFVFFIGLAFGYVAGIDAAKDRAKTAFEKLVFLQYNAGDDSITCKDCGATAKNVSSE